MASLPPATPPTHREMKVCIPVRLVTALHARKVLTGQPIGETVEAALRSWFDRQDASGQRAGVRLVLVAGLAEEGSA